MIIEGNLHIDLMETAGFDITIDATKDSDKVFIILKTESEKQYAIDFMKGFMDGFAMIRNKATSPIKPPEMTPPRVATPVQDPTDAQDGGEYGVIMSDAVLVANEHFKTLIRDRPISDLFSARFRVDKAEQVSGSMSPIRWVLVCSMFDHATANRDTYTMKLDKNLKVLVVLKHRPDGKVDVVGSTL
jgi:hypothetical protein